MDNLLATIDAYRDEHWDEIVADIETLVKIESVEDLDHAAPNAPYGPGPRRALDAALAMAQRMGFDIHDCEGHIGYADLAGASAEQIGIIGHVDVVPAGVGWNFEPYALTRKDGYLLGRGVLDDKGPVIVALHAAKFWLDQGEQLPYTIRVLFGANEETNMKDVDYYRDHYDDPAFLFTPDSQFPVGYGESGICSGMLTSAPITEGELLELSGGQAFNAVPSVAEAVVRTDKALAARPELGVTVEPCGSGRYRVRAQGVAAHASTPELGRNAIGLLVSYLLDEQLGSSQERAFLRLLKGLHDHTDGSALGVDCKDRHFGPLTAVGGVIDLKDGVISQTIDFRYPTTIDSAVIEQRTNDWAAAAGARFVLEHDKVPFLMDPDSHAVRALLDAYCEVTGEDAQGMTSKGGTYARCFTKGVSFGVEKSWESSPDWVGGMHGPDEGVSEALLKQAFSVYALALGNLMKVVDLRTS